MVSVALFCRCVAHMSVSKRIVPPVVPVDDDWQCLRLRVWHCSLRSGIGVVLYLVPRSKHAGC